MKTSISAAQVIAAAMAAMLLNGCEKPSQDKGNRNEAETPRPTELQLGSVTVFPGGENACQDSYLTLTFSSVPTLGDSGAIRILDSRGNEADMIDMADVAAANAAGVQMTDNTLFSTAMDAVGTAGYYRIVYYNAVTAEGNSVRIRPHTGSLEYGKEYSVVIEPGVIIADGFGGIGSGEWTFTVMPKPENKDEITVGGRDCDFMTLQGAVNYAVGRGQSAAVTITACDGIYDEPIFIRNKNNLTIKGESRGGTVVRFDNSNGRINGVGGSLQSVPQIGSPVGKTGGRSVILVENCDMLCFENITLENSHGHGSQAEVIYFNCDDGRLIARNCNFSSEQDTIELKGWSFFDNCLIRGDVDFIWGYPKTALFESCEIRSCRNDNGGYLVQARCRSADKGIVFLKCRLTAESGVGTGTVYLARSGGNSSERDNVTYLNCTMGRHIAGSGWYSEPAPNPRKATAENGWKEYRSMNESGVVMDMSGRYSGCRILDESEYESLYSSKEKIFAGCRHGSGWLR